MRWFAFVYEKKVIADLGSLIDLGACMRNLASMHVASNWRQHITNMNNAVYIFPFARFKSPAVLHVYPVGCCIVITVIILQACCCLIRRNNTTH